MAEDDFEEFRKRYSSGKLKQLANPPPVPGPGGILRAATGRAAQEIAKRVRTPKKKSSSSGPKSRKSESGTFTSRVDAMRKRERTPREKEQFGPLAKRKTTEVTPYKRPGGPVKKYERPGGPVTKYERPGGSVARQQASNTADKRDLAVARGGDKGRIVGISPTGKMVLGGAAVGAAAYADYNSRPSKGSAQETASGKTDKMTVNRREGGGGMAPSAASGKTDRQGSQSSKDNQGKQSFKDKMQGRNWKGGKTEKKVERKATPKAESKPKFKGNWRGASPSAMQARGGVRRTKAENLRRLFREK